MEHKGHYSRIVFDEGVKEKYHERKRQGTDGEADLEEEIQSKIRKVEEKPPGNLRTLLRDDRKDKRLVEEMGEEERGLMEQWIEENEFERRIKEGTEKLKLMLLKWKEAKPERSKQQVMGTKEEN